MVSLISGLYLCMLFSETCFSFSPLSKETLITYSLMVDDHLIPSSLFI